MLSSSILSTVHAHAEASAKAVLRQGRHAYCRERDLPQLLPRLSGEKPTKAEIVAHLKAALARERRLGAEGHWRYDLTRHTRLAAALAGEMQDTKAKRRP